VLRAVGFSKKPDMDAPHWGRRKMKRLGLAFLVLGVLAFSAAPTFASAILTDGSWHEFLFGGVGSFATGCSGSCVPTTDPVAEQTSTAPWTFSGPAVLTVQDLFLSVDRFQVFDNNVSLGDTSVETAGSDCGGDIGVCSSNVAFSRGVFSLGAGSHSITIQLIDSGAGGGAAVLSAATAAPEPSALPLLGLGLGLLAFVARKRIVTNN
jgi:hypothetical protein